MLLNRVPQSILRLQLLAQDSGTAPHPHLLVSCSKRSFLNMGRLNGPSLARLVLCVSLDSLFPVCLPLQGFNPAYPPQNPGYPAGPAMGVPAQPPYWNGPPQGQYPPGPGAPMVQSFTLWNVTEDVMLIDIWPFGCITSPMLTINCRSLQSSVCFCRTTQMVLNYVWVSLSVENNKQRCPKPVFLSFIIDIC